jgi:hypothetical protein
MCHATYIRLLTAVGTIAVLAFAVAAQSARVAACAL